MTGKSNGTAHRTREPGKLKAGRPHPRTNIPEPLPEQALRASVGTAVRGTLQPQRRFAAREWALWPMWVVPREVSTLLVPCLYQVLGEGLFFCSISFTHSNIF